MTPSAKFPPEEHAIARVREFVRDLAGVDITHPAVLVASELATNAVVHAASPFTVSVLEDGHIRIEVTDESPDLPVIREVEGRQFGMRIVKQLSERWGAEAFHADGKKVWADVAH